MLLGQWREHPESKQLARELGFAMARQHLRAGHDVILPQLIVRPDVVDQIAGIAHDAGAGFLEVVLLAPADELRSRLESSAREPLHPRGKFSIDELLAQIDHALPALEAIATARSDAVVVSVAGADRDAALAAVRHAIA